MSVKIFRGEVSPTYGFRFEWNPKFAREKSAVRKSRAANGLAEGVGVLNIRKCRPFCSAL